MNNFEDSFLDLCQGYSITNTPTPYYIKHYSVLDQIKFCKFYNDRVDFHIRSGKEKESDLLEKAIQSKRWSESKERTIKSYEDEIQSLNSKKKSIKDFFEIDALYNTIEESRASKNKILADKYSIIVDFAEDFAERDSREYQISHVCFKDKELTQPLFGESDLEYMSESEFAGVLHWYYSTISAFSVDKLKNLCIQQFLINLLSLIENYSNFFDKGPLQLSQYQLMFIKLAENYSKAALEEPEALEKFPDNAEKMLMCYFFKKNGGIIPSNKMDDGMALELKKLEMWSRK